MNGARLCWLICCAAALTACNSAKSEWSKATTADTIPAYQAFLSKYPNDAHVIDALARIVSLQDARAWSTALVASTTAGYQQYLTSEPNGAHAQAARNEISARERAAVWNRAQTDGTLKSLTDFLQRYSTGPEADQAREKLKILTAYRAELGTARSQRAADRERKALAKRFSHDLQNVIVLTPNTNSSEYRITSAPMSEQEADAKCASLKRRGNRARLFRSLDEARYPPASLNLRFARSDSPRPPRCVLSSRRESNRKLRCALQRGSFSAAAGIWIRVFVACYSAGSWLSARGASCSLIALSGQKSPLQEEPLVPGEPAPCAFLHNRY